MLNSLNRSRCKRHLGTVAGLNRQRQHHVEDSALTQTVSSLQNLGDVISAAIVAINKQLDQPQRRVRENGNHHLQSGLGQGNRPGLGHSVVQVVGGETGSTEEVVCSGWIVQCNVKHQNTLPSAGDTVDFRAQNSLPFFLDESRTSDQRRNRSDWNHVNTMDVLDVGSKIGGVSNLVLEPNTTAVVLDVLGWHHRVVLGVQEVGVEGSLGDGKHQVGSVGHVGVVDGLGPDLHTVSKIVVLTATFLVLSIGVDGNSVGNGVAQIKVKVSEHREVGVVAGRIGHVSHKSVDPVLNRVDPRSAQVGVHKSTDGSSMDVVAVVEMVVVVESVTVIHRSITFGHTTGGADSTPVCLHVVKHIKNVGVLVQDLSGRVHGVNVGIRVDVVSVLVGSSRLDGAELGVGVVWRGEAGDGAPWVLTNGCGQRLGHLKLVGQVGSHGTVDGVVQSGRGLGIGRGGGEGSRLVRHGIHDGGVTVGGARGGILECVANDGVGVFQSERTCLVVSERHVHDPSGTVVQDNLVLVCSGSWGSVTVDRLDSNSRVEFWDQVVINSRDKSHTLDERSGQRASALGSNGHIDGHFLQIGQLDGSSVVKVGGAKTKTNVSRWSLVLVEYQIEYGCVKTYEVWSSRVRFPQKLFVCTAPFLVTPEGTETVEACCENDELGLEVEMALKISPEVSLEAWTDIF
ncbi:hypothetical protein OGAPHI_006995 [Ogataea philodendri]|uniref:Uncharacterized protein n=1 Tax=Ogataea philodendri TaxID=1378263 RepID=A0A9P8SZT0_9ASCO|nr:uncharacterized protein OGAPHI_006995 [Ogataea philodendri]KAH3660409.1 hypothetical protein OGAPHI_006995 [Ogataea philodendri]